MHRSSFLVHFFPHLNVGDEWTTHCITLNKFLVTVQELLIITRKQTYISSCIIHLLLNIRKVEMFVQFIEWSKLFFVLPWYSSGSECLPVSVETIPPTFADMFLSSSANLTCKISNIPAEADYSTLNVTWTRASDHKQLPTVMTNFLEQENNLYYVNAVATVCATEWKVDETFICKVTLDVLVKPVEKTLKKESGKLLVDPWKAFGGITCSRRFPDKRDSPHGLKAFTPE